MCVGEYPIEEMDMCNAMSNVLLRYHCLESRLEWGSKPC